MAVFPYSLLSSLIWFLFYRTFEGENLLLIKLKLIMVLPVKTYSASVFYMKYAVACCGFNLLQGFVISRHSGLGSTTAFVLDCGLRHNDVRLFSVLCLPSSDV